jgi:putative ATP-dependent endonuclease of OLD family
MARIRAIEICNFRGIKSLAWFTSSGVNCLLGPGDSGKSTILDAVDFCLGARRNLQFTDADFYGLDVETPISISVTIGELDNGLKNLEAYGMYLRGFDAQSDKIEDEPEKDAETVLTVRLTVANDLEPSWSLVSERAEAQGQSRNLSWNDRVRLAPTRIGVMADYHLAGGAVRCLIASRRSGRTPPRLWQRRHGTPAPFSVTKWKISSARLWGLWRPRQVSLASVSETA